MPKDRTEVEALDNINQGLKHLGLRTFGKLGRREKGEYQLLRISNIYDHAKNYFIDIEFDCFQPDGSTGKYTIRFNANGAISDGNIIVLQVEKRIAFIEKWRAPVGDLCLEVPRGFGTDESTTISRSLAASTKVSGMPVGLLNRFLGEQLATVIDIRGLEYIGRIIENSSSHAVFPDVFIAHGYVHRESDLTKVLKEHQDIHLWTPQEIEYKVYKGQIEDAHTLATLMKVISWIKCSRLEI